MVTVLLNEAFVIYRMTGGRKKKAAKAYIQRMSIYLTLAARLAYKTDFLMASSVLCSLEALRRQVSPALL
jgi:predicted LPLAT superfamily acyltransferase